MHHEIRVESYFRAEKEKDFQKKKKTLAKKNTIPENTGTNSIASGLRSELDLLFPGVLERTVRCSS